MWVARRAAEKYLSEHAKGEDADDHNLMLYYGAFFFFARAALYAVERSDGQFSEQLTVLQFEHFKSEVRNHPVFKLLTEERNRIGHGDDS